MLRQPGRAFSRHQLMDAAIGEGSIVLERTIDVHVKTLRRKIAAKSGMGELIETVRGVGYRFRETPEMGAGTKGGVVPPQRRLPSIDRALLLLPAEWQFQFLAMNWVYRHPHRAWQISLHFL